MRFDAGGKMPHMPVVSLVISSASLLFLTGAIVLSAVFPGNTAMHHYSVALFCWFVGIGPVAWMQNRIEDILDAANSTSDAYVGWRIFFLLIVVLFVSIGAYNFLQGLA
jgi:hypothetical protein